MGILYIVATPIGNLEDITLRALRILKEVDIILCEDTRVTKKLLERFGIEKVLISYHRHSRLEKTEQIRALLEQGENLALVSDAGTPGISDPGNQLVKELTEKLPDVAIAPIPGPSALTTIASIAGFPMDRFVFLGFPPAKKGRKKFFAEALASPYPVIFYESLYRILKTLQDLEEILGKSAAANSCSIVVGRELTKKFETIHRGTAQEVLAQLKKDQLRGEFVLVIAPTSHP